MSLLDLTIEAGIPDDVMRSLIDGTHRTAADFGMQMENITLTAFDRITKEVKRYSELMRKVNNGQT